MNDLDLDLELQDLFDEVPFPEETQVQPQKQTYREQKFQTQQTPDIDESLIDKLHESNKNMAEKANVRIDEYIDILKQKIFFINKELTETIPFCRDNLYLMMSQSGGGKSTIVANISYSLYVQQKNTLIISTEEGAEDCLMRIACLDLDVSFNSYKKGKMLQEQIQKCKELFPKITKYVKILGVNEPDISPTNIDDVRSILEGSLKHEYSAIIIDYFQLIRTRKNSTQSTYEVLDDLRLFFQSFMKRSKAPLVVMSQLYSQGKRKSNDIDARLKNNSNILETASVAIEVVPDFAESSSTFKIMKDRFGSQGKELKFFFKFGKYISYKEVSIEDRLGLENYENLEIGEDRI